MLFLTKLNFKYEQKTKKKFKYDFNKLTATGNFIIILKDV